jgi:hypothetical protein
MSLDVRRIFIDGPIFPYADLVYLPKPGFLGLIQGLPFQPIPLELEPFMGPQEQVRSRRVIHCHR